jgi:hypothetical protein
MKLPALALLAAALAVVPCAVFAADAKPKKKTPAKVPPSVTVKDLAIGEARKCDANHNGRIDGSEMMSVRQAWKSNPKSHLYLFDDNSNQYLEDSELSKLDLGGGKKPAASGKKSDNKKK